MRNMPCWIILCSFVSVGVTACGTSQPEEVTGKNAERRELAMKTSPRSEQSPVKSRSMPGAQETFDRVMRLVKERYVEEGMSEDLLWTGAVEGMLQQLIQTRGLRVNVLLDPREIKEMNIGIKGKLSGVGVVIKMISELCVIREVLPDGPGARAGLKAGDRILAIDGKKVKELDLMGVVSLIRGPAGSEVELFIQRDTEEWKQRVVRGQIKLQSVFGQLLEADVAYLRITQFSRDTLERLDATLEEQISPRTRALVLDLRNCPGGLLDVSIGSASRFLEPGKLIVNIHKRGEKPRAPRSTQVKSHIALPMVVLINKHTSSGAEILAAALAENDRATLVGETTLGKGTVEEIMELDRGWAVKLSVGRFFGPAGEAIQGKGIQPHITISAPELNSARGRGELLTPEIVEADQQLKAALYLVRPRRAAAQSGPQAR